MEKRIDCRGLACPQPVLEAKKALEGTDELIVLLDSQSSKENVKRFAESQGHQVGITEENGVFALKITKQKREEKAPAGSGTSKDIQPPASSDLVVFIDTDSMGRGSEELGKILMRSFLQTLEQSDIRPRRVILLNSGVKLACQGSEVLDDLQELASKGAEILACGTCLDFFGIKKNLMAGRASNMYEILNSLAKAGKVLKI